MTTPVQQNAWRRNRKGTLWCQWKHLTVSVFFVHGRDRYKWSIADGKTVKFSDFSYETEDDAIEALDIELDKY